MSNKTKWFGYGIAAVIAVALLGWAIGASAATPSQFGLTEGDVIRASGDPDIYIVNDAGYKRLFVNPAIFNLYGHLGWAKVKEVAPSTRDAFVTSGLFRVSGDTKVYALEVTSEDVAVLHWLNMTGAAAVSEDPAFPAKVFTINDGEKALYGVGADYTSLAQVPAYSRGGALPPPVGGIGFNPNGDTQGEILGWDVGSPDESELGEGQKGEVAVFEVELDDEGPLMLTSLDVTFEQTDLGGQSFKPWDYFDSFSLTVDGKKVATVDVDSDAFSKDGTEYRARLSGLSVVLPSDETTDLGIEVSMLNSVDSEDEGADWSVELGSYRVLDESGFLVSDDAGVSDSFEVTAPEVADVVIRDAEEEIDSFVIEVSETQNTNGVAVYTFEIEEQEGVDVTIDELQVSFDTDGYDANDVLAKAYLFNGSTKIGEESIPASGVVLFENLGLAIDGDDAVELTVKVDLRDNNEGARYAEGTELSVEVDAANIVAEDEFGNDEGDILLDVDAESNTHELRSSGVSLALVDVSEDVDTEATPDTLTATFEFKVTAFGGDVVVTDVGLDKSASADIVDYVIDGPTDLEVDEGQTENFSVTVVLEPNASGFAKVWMTDVDFTLDGDPFTFSFGLEDYESAQKFLNL